ncbi:hypothetical protein BDV98DRAFT_570097 [Pterulicium gracile]|uniref:Zn(2)-C6 fungal-type domain-containing protein n=1 Tax=Pterulicium gracile TaxID=1884261 RepID=A0A5C3QGA6_9AGAR|nr:hypothetical protein BDV98DRAFT_570097 [Pterula gracilis]
MARHAVACNSCRVHRKKCRVFDNDVSCHKCLRKGVQCSYLLTGAQQTSTSLTSVYSRCKSCVQRRLPVSICRSESNSESLRRSDLTIPTIGNSRRRL